jgi:alpha-beta hydrolase superfamily lysophospholipase
MKHGNEYLSGQGDWTVMAPKVSKMRSHSHDPRRVKLEYAWATQNPSLQVGGATWQWLYCFQKSCQVMSGDYLGKIATPVLIGCPTADHIADPEKMRALATRLPNGKLFEDIDARHDLFLEDDAHRQPWIDAIFKFIGDKTCQTPRLIKAK